MSRLRKPELVPAALVFVSLLAAAALVGAGSTVSAAAKSHKRASPIRVKQPLVVIAGSSATVRGSVARSLKAGRVALERQRPPRKAWHRVARSRVRHGKFRFRLRAPEMTGALKLRVVGGHPLKKSAAFALPVTQTEVLDGSLVISAPAPGESGELVLGGTAKPRSVGFLDISPGPKTPDGLLVRVTGVTGSPGHWVVSVVPAGLFDAIPAGQIDFTPPPLDAAGVAPSSASTKSAISPRFDVDCDPSTGATSQATGSATLSLQPHLEMHWGWSWFPPHPELNSARFTLTAAGQAQASVSLSGQGKCSKEVTLFDKKFNGFGVEVGPIPVWIVPELLAKLSADANASAAVSTSMQASVSATGGLSYNGSGISPIANFTHNFSFDPPHPQGQGSIGGRVVPGGILLIYGLAGPEVDLSAGPQFDVGLGADFNWRLYIPVDLLAKFVVPHILSLGPLNVFHHEFTLAEGSLGPPPQHNLTVAVNGPGTVTGSGISCPGTCTKSYPEGTSVTLHASPDAGASFDGWSGDCSGSTDCTLGMNQDHTASAGFSTTSVSDQQTVSSTGPLTQIFLNNNLACQVAYTGDTSFEFYDPGVSDPGDCGTQIAIPGGSGSTVYGQDNFSAGPTSPYSPYNLVSQTPVSGDGTAGSPYTVTTVVAVPTTSLDITETDSYVVGDDAYTSQIAVANGGASDQTATLYHTADCYLADSDVGFGYLDGAGGTFCTQNADNSPAGRTEGFVPTTAGSHRVEGQYSTVWDEVDGTNFPDSCDCATSEDNMVGLSWAISVPAGGQVTESMKTQFSAP